GAGPFRVEEAIEGERVRLARNRDFFVAGEPLLDELTFRLDLRSFRDVAEAFVREELDIAHAIPLKMVEQLQDEPRIAPYLQQTIQLHTSYVGYDSSKAPFDRVEVRQAVNHAINRQRINERVYGGLGMIAESLLPPGLLGYDPSIRGLAYDPERARQLLRQAGHASGFEIEYRTWETDEFNNSGLVPLLIEDLEAVGIRVRVTRHTAPEASGPRQEPGHGLLYCANWYADFPDPDNFFYVLFHTDSTTVRGLHYHRPEVDAQIVEARRTNDTERRADIYRRLDEMVVHEAPLAPLFHERLYLVHKPGVRGVRTSLVPPPVRYNGVWLENGD
ncbi:MAG TPA: ABC transporter substrate-binding protein, partial [Candidatus Dormibacteraeota bacterium]|nr:ABC transporter substrate-binding protein [Candidatus Dormibacteraeota bacterium]